MENCAAAAGEPHSVRPLEHRGGEDLTMAKKDGEVFLWHDEASFISLFTRRAFAKRILKTDSRPADEELLAKEIAASLTAKGLDPGTTFFLRFQSLDDRKIAFRAIEAQKVKHGFDVTYEERSILAKFTVILPSGDAEA